MRRLVSVGSGGVVCGFALACGGASVPPRAHLEAVCATVPFAADVGRLAETELPARPVDGVAWVVGDPESGANALALSVATGQPVVLVPTAATPASALLEALRAMEDRGSAVIVVDSGTEVVVPASPDPTYEADLRGRLTHPDMRGGQLADELQGLLFLCPPASEMFSAVAFASPEAKCQLLAAGLEEVLPNCPFTSADQVITAIQVANGPWPGTLQRSTITLNLAAGGIPLELGTGTWGDVAAAVAKLDGQAVSLPDAPVP